MRWVLPEHPPGPKEGDKKTVTKFLILPMTLENKDGYKETRWCEIATIQLECCAIMIPQDGGGSCCNCWVPKKWAD